MRLLAPALVTAALLLAPQVVPAQSLGDVAAKEKEKKEKEKDKKPAKAYTEEDLRGKLGGTMSNPGATAGTPDSTATGDAAAASPAPAASPSAEEQEAKQKEWRDRRDRTQQDVVRITASISSFEARLADNTQPMYGPGREALIQNLERAKADLTRAQSDLNAAEAEGRANGYH